MRRPSEATVSTKLGKVLSKKVTQVHLERITLATMLSTDWGTGAVEDERAS